jgi:hypothetical protein
MKLRKHSDGWQFNVGKFQVNYPGKLPYEKDQRPDVPRPSGKSRKAYAGALGIGVAAASVSVASGLDPLSMFRTTNEPPQPISLSSPSASPAAGGAGRSPDTSLAGRGRIPRQAARGWQPTEEEGDLYEAEQGVELQPEPELLEQRQLEPEQQLQLQLQQQLELQLEQLGETP